MENKKFNFLVEKIFNESISIEAENENEAKNILEKMLNNIDFSKSKFRYQVIIDNSEKEKLLSNFKNEILLKINVFKEIANKIKVIIENIGYYTFDLDLPIVNKPINECENNDILILNKLFSKLKEQSWKEAKNLGISEKSFNNDIFCFKNFTFNECFEDLKTRVYECKLNEDLLTLNDLIISLNDINENLNINNIEIQEENYKNIIKNTEELNFTADEINEKFNIDSEDNNVDSEEIINSCNSCNLCLFKTL